MRLLHQRHDHAGRRRPEAQAQTDGGGHQGRAGQQSLPLRHASAVRARDSTRRGGRWTRAPMLQADLPRRAFLKGTGALVVGFTLGWHRTAIGAATPHLGPYGPAEDEIDSWLAIGEDGSVTLYTGCCELGTGSTTGLLQIMAEELDVAITRTRLISPDTDRTPDQFVSSGSRTIAYHARPIRQAAAEARQALLDLAAERLQVPVVQLVPDDGTGSLPEMPQRKLSYAELVGGRGFDLKVTGKVRPKAPKDYKAVGPSVPRAAIPPKVRATFAYTQTLTGPDM